MDLVGIVEDPSYDSVIHLASKHPSMYETAACSFSYILKRG